MTLQTRSQINTSADTNLPDNTSGDISPADVRGVVKDLADSAVIMGKGSAITCAATITIGAENFYHVTGSTGPITDIDFSSGVDGSWAWLEFDSTPTITHNGTTLNLPGGASIVAAAGDRMLVVQDSSDNVHVLAYVRASGRPIKGDWEHVATLAPSGASAINFDSSNGIAIEAGYDYIIDVAELQPSTDAYIILQFGTGAGPTYQTASYVTQIFLHAGASTASALSAVTTGIHSYVSSAGGAVAEETLNMIYDIRNPGANTRHRVEFRGSDFNSSGAFRSVYGSGYRAAAEVLTGLRIIPSTGTFTGTAVLSRRKVA